MAVECPSDLAPVQGPLGATQRDFVAIVRAACLAWPKTAPFYYPGAGSRLLARSQHPIASAPLNDSSNAADPLMEVRALRTRSVSHFILRDQRR
jgi:hypothetical protein